MEPIVKINDENLQVTQICYTFASNNTCHGSRKITAPGQVFAFYSLASLLNKGYEIQ